MNFMIWLALILCLLISTSLCEKKIKSCYCLAYLDVENPLSETNRLDTLDETKDIPNNINCDNRGEFMCKAMCKETFRIETNQFDLSKAPNTTKEITVPLGQYLCDLIHRDVSSLPIGMSSELTCLNSVDNSLTTSSLKISLDQTRRLTCKAGKYVKE